MKSEFRKNVYIFALQVCNDNSSILEGWNCVRASLVNISSVEGGCGVCVYVCECVCVSHPTTTKEFRI